MGVCNPVLQILTLLRPNLVSKIHTLFQTRHLRNYIIITLIRPRTKKISHSHISLSFYLIWNWKHEYVHTLLHAPVPLRTVPDSRPKRAKSIPVFRPKRRKNPTPWGGTYLYGLYPPGFSLFPKKYQRVRFILTGV